MVDLETGETSPDQPSKKAAEPKGEGKESNEQHDKTKGENLGSHDESEEATNEKPKAVSTHASESENDMDVRKKFFYSILQSGGQAKTAFALKRERTVSDLKRSRSESDMEVAPGSPDKDHQDVSKSSEDLINPVGPGSSSRSAAAEKEGSETQSNTGDGESSETQSAADNREESETQSTAGNREESETQSVAGDKEGNAMQGNTGQAADSRDETFVGKDNKSSSKPPEKLTRHQSEDLGSHITRQPPMKSQSLDIEIGADAAMKNTFIGAPTSEPEVAATKFEGTEEEATGPSPSKPKSRPYVDVPEFTWSMLHQRLLTELLFAVESDIQVWKT